MMMMMMMIAMPGNKTHNTDNKHKELDMLI